MVSVLVLVSMMALQLSRLSYTGLPCSTIIVVRFGHASKAVSLMCVTEEGMVMLVRPVWAKAKFPMLSTALGIAMSVRFGQPVNAQFPMLVTLFGMVMPLSVEQSQKALAPMLVTVLLNLMMPLPFS